MLSKGSGNADKAQRCVITEMSSPFGIKGNAVFPHFIQSGIGLGCFIQPGEQNGDAKHHEKLMLQVSFQPGFLYVIQMAGGKAFFRYQNLVAVPF